jgi:hypothetical protein
MLFAFFLIKNSKNAFLFALLCYLFFPFFSPTFSFFSSFLLFSSDRKMAAAAAPPLQKEVGKLQIFGLKLVCAGMEFAWLPLSVLARCVGFVPDGKGKKCLAPQVLRMPEQARRRRKNNTWRQSTNLLLCLLRQTRSASSLSFYCCGSSTASSTASSRLSVSSFSSFSPHLFSHHLPSCP